MHRVETGDLLVPAGICMQPNSESRKSRTELATGTDVPGDAPGDVPGDVPGLLYLGPKVGILKSSTQEL
jgi:hypothetical protein